MMPVWAVLPAAGAGRRFGGEVPKQYRHAAGMPVIAHALDAVLVNNDVAGAMVALAPADPHWPGWTVRKGKPVHTCVGGGDRATSVLNALDAIAAFAGEDTLVLVHDAARPNLSSADLAGLIAAARCSADGALLAAPVRDTIKRADADRCSGGTEPRERLWRAFTPQAARLGVLRRALSSALAEGGAVTDEAMALERLGLRPRLVEGRDDNIKVTTHADLALVDYLLSRSATGDF